MSYKALPVGGALLTGTERNQKSRAGGLTFYYPGGPRSERGSTFWDAFCDGFSTPEDLEPTWVYPGPYWGRAWDAYHIRGYFEKAIADFAAASPAATGLAVAGRVTRQKSPGEEALCLNNLTDPHRQFRPTERVRHQ